MSKQRAKAKRVRECPTCHGDGIVQTKPAGAGYADDLAEYAPCPDCQPTVRYGKLTPAQKKRNYEYAQKVARGGRE